MPYKTRKGVKVKIMTENERSNSTLDEIEMDLRAKEAVRMAIRKAEICKKPIARYDAVIKKPYIEYPDGTRKYAE